MSHYRQPCPNHRFRPQLAVYSWCKQLAAVVEVAVEEVSFHFVVAVAEAQSADPSHSPLDSKDYPASSNPSAPCFDYSSPSGRRAGIVEMAAYWPDCDGSVCSDAFEHPCHRRLDNDRACQSSCRNL